MLRRLSVVVAGLVVAWLIASAVLFAYPQAETGAPRHADVVVVLSGQSNRLPPALALARRGAVGAIAISSIRKTPRWRAARRLCAAGGYRGVPVVCFEAVPYSTRGEARTVTRLARRRGWHSIVVSTSTFHVTRAHMLFRRCWRGPLWFVGSSSPWWRLPADWASETGKLIVQLTVQRGC